MSNINTPITPDQEINMNTNFLITSLFQKYIDNGGTPTSSAFRRHVDMLIKTSLKSHLDDAKGKSAEIAGSAADSIKSHFCRGRKWVTIPSDHDMFVTVKSEALIQDYNDLADLWESRGFAWVRFHSTKGTLVNFSIHPNSSVGSNIKVAMTAAAALELEVLNGTPKSNGFEDRVQPMAADPEPEVSEAPVEETADEISPDEEVMIEDETSHDEETESVDHDAEIQALLAEELEDELDIDGDFDIDSL